MFRLFLVAALLHPFLITLALPSEKSPVKFGKVAPEDFVLPAERVDTSAGAVVISDIGYSAFIGNNNGGLSLEFKRHKRIMILKRTSLDAANFEIPLYLSGGSEERVTILKGFTYNLENGKVTETKLESGAVFSDKLDKNHKVTKFTMPAVKEGSIVDVNYTIVSDFTFNLQDWSFQGAYPVLWSEYEVTIPSFFKYVFMSQGYLPFHINESKSDNVFYNLVSTPEGMAGRTDRSNYKGTATTSRWVMKDMPALKVEPFTSSLGNHISRIDFQLQAYLPPLEYKDVMGSWESLARELNQDESFAANLYKPNNWLAEVVQPLTAGKSTQTEKAFAIYTWLRDNYTCTDHTARYLTTNLRDVAKNKSGSVADINLLLVAMLHHAGITAKPVLLSRRHMGVTSDVYPLISKFNYVIVIADIDDSQALLDATVPMLGFGKLLPSCYNGHARVIAESALPIYLESDSLLETKQTLVSMVSDEGKWKGKVTATSGYYESLAIREKLKEKGEGALKDQIKAALPEEVMVETLTVDSLKQYELPVKVSYKIDMSEALNNDIIYLNPMMGDGYKENLFKSAKRNYPVEMPYAVDETYIANIFVPEGYVVDEVPKSVRVKLGEDDGMFEYLVQKDQFGIMLRSRLLIKRALFASEEYEDLRNFFTFVVQKHSEQVVIKKAKP